MNGRILMIIILLVNSLIAHSQDDVKLKAFDLTECLSANLNANVRTRIIEKRFQKELFLIKIGLPETCCLTFNPILSYKSDMKDRLDTLFLDYQTAGAECECDCYYEFTYKIRGLKNSKFEILFKGKPVEFSSEKYVTFPIKYTMLGNDTVNFVDKYGLKQGFWTFDSVQIKKYYFFKDNIHIRELRFSMTATFKDF
jgi:hypothetical protein